MKCSQCTSQKALNAQNKHQTVNMVHFVPQSGVCLVFKAVKRHFMKGYITPFQAQDMVRYAPICTQYHDMMVCNYCLKRKGYALWQIMQIRPPTQKVRSSYG